MVFPSRNIISGLSQRAHYFRETGHSYSEIIRKGVSIEPNLILIEPQYYQMFSSYVKVNGEYSLRNRPIFPEWSMRFNLVIRDNRIKPYILRDILSDLGNFGGIGDFRQEYGRFTVEIFRSVDNEQV